MATRTENRSSSSNSSKRNRSRNGSRSTEDRSAFSWGGNSGRTVGVALAGVAVGLAANVGRKLLRHAVTSGSGDWDEMLAKEHDLVEALFEKALATDSSQTAKRAALLTEISHSLDKHAHEEENVVYPALRQAHETVAADQLDSEHSYIKTYVYALSRMDADDPAWLEKIREFRDLVVRHMRTEENEVFPRFKRTMTDEQNAKLTALVHKDGYWMA
jgi:hemerythrin superfamily protein